MKQRRTGHFFLLVNTFLPLIVGTCFYLLFRPDTYVTHWARALFPVLKNLDYTLLPGFLFLICNSFFCDMLWAYSLTFVLFSIVPEPKRLFPIWLIVFLFSFLWELGQLFGIFPGTADVFDVLFQSLSSLVAILLIKTYKKETPT